MTSNPMMQDRIYSNQIGISDNPMTIAGATNKAMFLLGVLALTAIYTWKLTLTGFMDKAFIFLWGGLIAGLILVITMAFKPQQSKVLGLAYAVCEGLVLGVLSAIYEARFQGIVINAVTLTFTTMFGMLLLYRTGIIKATNRFRKTLLTAMFGILAFYFISIISSFFGATFMSPFFEGPLGIGISLVIVAVAALNFILDFDFIEKGSQNMMPKYFEWYGAVGLLVTLVWLYIEMLRLLSMFARRN